MIQLCSGSAKNSVVVDFLLVSLALMGVPALLAGADVDTIAHGSRVDIEKHLVPGKYVVFDFYADWCGPCRALAPVLQDLASANQDKVALRKVDIQQWGSPVSQQYRITFVPQLKLYDPDGRLVEEGRAGVVLKALERRLGTAGAGNGQAGARNANTHSGGGAVLIVLLFAAALVSFYVLCIRRPVQPGPRPAAKPVPARPAGRSEPVTVARPMWFVKIQGAVEGPFSPEQLRNLAQRAKLQGKTPVRLRSESRWRSLDEVLTPPPPRRETPPVSIPRVQSPDLQYYHEKSAVAPRNQ